MTAIRESISHAHRACRSVFVTTGSGTPGDDGLDFENLGSENRKRSMAIDERMQAFGRLCDNAVPLKTRRILVARALPKSLVFRRNQLHP